MRAKIITTLFCLFSLQTGGQPLHSQTSYPATRAEIKLRAQKDAREDFEGKGKEAGMIFSLLGNAAGLVVYFPSGDEDTSYKAFAPGLGGALISTAVSLPVSTRRIEVSDRRLRILKKESQSENYMRIYSEVYREEAKQIVQQNHSTSGFASAILVFLIGSVMRDTFFVERTSFQSFSN